MFLPSPIARKFCSDENSAKSLSLVVQIQLTIASCFRIISHRPRMFRQKSRCVTQLSSTREASQTKIEGRGYSKMFSNTATEMSSFYHKLLPHLFVRFSKNIQLFINYVKVRKCPQKTQPSNLCKFVCKCNLHRRCYLYCIRSRSSIERLLVCFECQTAWHALTCTVRINLCIQ